MRLAFGSLCSRQSACGNRWTWLAYPILTIIEKTKRHSHIMHIHTDRQADRHALKKTQKTKARETERHALKLKDRGLTDRQIDPHILQTDCHKDRPTNNTDRPTNTTSANRRYRVSLRDTNMSVDGTFRLLTDNRQRPLRSTLKPLYYV